jgi:uncharacterized protein with HEPN domain
MDQRVRKLLEDVRQAIGAIEQFTSGKTLAEYKADLLLRSGVERQFLVVGEAVAQLAKLDETTAARLGDYRRIVDFRNILIHGYSVLDDRIVWETAQDDLPVLRENLMALLDQPQPGAGLFLVLRGPGAREHRVDIDYLIALADEHAVEAIDAHVEVRQDDVELIAELRFRVSLVPLDAAVLSARALHAQVGTALDHVGRLRH